MCNTKIFFTLWSLEKGQSKSSNSNRLHLNRKGANILSSSLRRHITKIFNWQLSGNTSCSNVSESDFKENASSNLKQAKENCWHVLSSLCKDNLEKLIFAHLNINSIRNKFYFLSKQIRGSTLMKSGTTLKLIIQLVTSFVITYHIFKHIYNKTMKYW